MNKLLDCITNKSSTEVPVWFMRQAGRYLPEFREIRKNNQNFIKLCLNPNLVKEITLQPLKRFDLDAAIIFSDILMIPYALGQKVEFKKGMGLVLGDIDIKKIIKVKDKDFLKKLTPVYKGMKKIRNSLKEKKVIGFTGAPWTLLVYMLHKKSPKKNFKFNNIFKKDRLLLGLLKKIERSIYLHAKKQFSAGANVIQIFDSWAGLIPKKKLNKYCYEPTKRIVKKLKKDGIPVVCFPRGIGKNYIPFCSKVKPDCINIDYDINPKWARNKFKQIPIQGGLDPKLLLKNKAKLKKEVENYLKTFSGYPYIFNLGHGVLPQTKPETIKYITDLVRERL